MNIRNLNYANMVNDAQDILNNIWIPAIGDLAIDESGMVGVIINRDKQEIKVDPDNLYHAYVGVSLMHNNKVWESHTPIWMPRLDQVIEFMYDSMEPQCYLDSFNRWITVASVNYAYTEKFTEVIELAFAYYMHIRHSKRWNFEEKKWKSIN